MIALIRKPKPPPVLCSWCDRPAAAKGDDGTLSCGQGQGDGLEPHDNVGVQYMPLHEGGRGGWQRLPPQPQCSKCGFHHPPSGNCMTPYRLEDR